MHEVRTAGSPVALRLTLDRASLDAGERDLSYVTAEVVDEAGTVHPAATNRIRFALEGPGRLVAVGNNDPQSEEVYVGGERSAYRGRVLAVVESSGEPGEIELEAASDGVQADRTTIQIRSRDVTNVM